MSSLIDRANQGLCVLNIAFVHMSVSLTITATLISDDHEVWNNVLGTTAERAKCKNCFISLPFQHVGGFVNIFRRSRQRAMVLKEGGG